VPGKHQGTVFAKGGGRVGRGEGAKEKKSVDLSKEIFSGENLRQSQGKSGENAPLTQ